MKLIRTPGRRAKRSEPKGDQGAIVRATLYLPLPMHEALRTVAFGERVRIHDLVLEGITAALRKRGYVAKGKE